MEESGQNIANEHEPTRISVLVKLALVQGFLLLTGLVAGIFLPASSSLAEMLFGAAWGVAVSAGLTIAYACLSIGITSRIIGNGH